VSWESKGHITVEADDADEAGELVTEALENFDVVMVDAITVDEVKIIDTTTEEGSDGV
jgi:capsular polysaccharide biosynthesis protein